MTKRRLTPRGAPRQFFPRLPGTAGGGHGQPLSAAAASAAAHAHIFGNDDASRLHIDDILRAFGSDPAAQQARGKPEESICSASLTRTSRRSSRRWLRLGQVLRRLSQAAGATWGGGVLAPSGAAKVSGHKPRTRTLPSRPSQPPSQKWMHMTRLLQRTWKHPLRLQLTMRRRWRRRCRTTLTQTRFWRRWCINYQ